MKQLNVGDKATLLIKGGKFDNKGRLLSAWTESIEVNGLETSLHLYRDNFISDSENSVSQLTQENLEDTEIECTITETPADVVKYRTDKKLKVLPYQGEDITILHLGSSSVSAAATAATMAGVTSATSTGAPVINVAPQFNCPDLTFEANQIEPNRWRLTLGLFDREGRMVKGTVQFSANHEILFDNVGPTMLHSIKLDGKKWAFVEVTFTKALELDAFVDGFLKKKELQFESPETVCPAPVPYGRVLFAAIGIWVLAISALCAWSESLVHVLTPQYTDWHYPLTWIVAAIPAVAFFVTFFFLARNYNNHVNDDSPPEGFAAIIMGTNNRWWKSLGFLFVLSIVFLVIVQWGSPLAVDLEATDKNGKVVSEYRVGDDAQRMRNAWKSLDYRTNRDIYGEAPVVTWDAAATRFDVMLVLLFMWILYFFVAFWDEVVRGVKKTHNRLFHSTEGSTSGWSEIFSRSRQETPASSQGGAGSRVWAILKSIVGVVGIDIVIEVLQRFWRISRKSAD